MIEKRSTYIQPTEKEFGCSVVLETYVKRFLQAEKKYIAANVDVKKRPAADAEKVPPLPVRKVLTSAPVWAALCGLVAFAWLAFSAMTLTPTYLDRVQNVDVDIVCTCRAATRQLIKRTLY